MARNEYEINGIQLNASWFARVSIRLARAPGGWEARLAAESLTPRRELGRPSARFEATASARTKRRAVARVLRFAGFDDTKPQPETRAVLDRLGRD